MAITRQRVQFGTPERLLGWAIQQLDQRHISQVPQTVLDVDEVITAVEVSVVFDDGDAATDLLENAERVLLPEGWSNRLLEDLYFDPPDVPGHPLVEDGAQKSTPSLRRHGAVAHTPVGLRSPLDQGKKA
jgi:hypothetical protein